MDWYKTVLYLLIVYINISPELHAGRRKVLIIGVDGVRSDVLSSMKLSMFNKFETEGFGTYFSWNQDITISGPSWSSILCGVYHDKHKIKDNTFQQDNYKEYPMLPKLLNDMDQNLKCGIYMEWANLREKCTNNGWYEILQGVQGNTKLTSKTTTKWIQTSDLDLYFVYFGAPDYWGHIFGFSKYNPFYKLALKEVNKAIEDLESSIKSRAHYQDEDWLILTTTDHGGKSNSHGGFSVEERQVFWFAYSERIKNYQFKTHDEGNMNMCDNNFCKRSYRITPVHVDIVSTAIHHLVYDTCNDFESCLNSKLEGKSWLHEMGMESMKLENNISFKLDPKNSMN